MKKKARYLMLRIGLAGGAACLLFVTVLLLLGVHVGIHHENPLPLLFAAAIGGALMVAIYRFCYLPYRETEKVLRLFATGYTLQGLYQMRYSYSPAFDEVIEKTREFLDGDQLLSESKRQAQYLALQNQINPHFLYNTLEGIRGEAMMKGVDSIAEMTEALATFFRYTISKVENLVSVEDELSNIETYFSIQQYRFGERIQLKVLCDTDDRNTIYSCKLPKLTLQPIVENAIIHGIERKVGNGLIQIHLQLTETRLLIFVSDDGVGMSAEMLEKLNSQINNASLDTIRPEKDRHGGIALVNVHNRVRLLFGEEYGLVVYSTPQVGTDVELTLPAIHSERELPKKGVRHAS